MTSTRTPLRAPLLWVASAGLILSVLAIVAAGGDKPASSQPASAPTATTAPAARSILCPVGGKPIDRRIVERFRGKWVYFADEDCRKKFLADPYEYSDGVMTQWEADEPLRVQVVCPVTGQPVDSGIYEGRGQDAVFFANAAARDRWRADPARFRQRLENECYTYQTGCADCGGEISPAARVLVDGRAIYFCCDGCAKALDTDREACLARVEKQVRANRAAWERDAAASKAKAAPASQPASHPAGKAP